MAGVRVRVDARRLRRAIRDAERAPLDAWREIGELIVSSIQRNFEASGRPKRWAPLKYRQGKPLIDTGRLRASINAKADAAGVTVGTNLIYAATHQFGRDAIPARPFVVLQSEDQREIARILAERIASHFR